MPRLIQSILLLAALAALSACGRDGGLTDGSSVSPDGAVIALVDALRADDLQKVLRRSMSDDDYARARSEWDAARAGAVDPNDREQINAALAALDDDAFVDVVMAEIGPALEAARPNLPLMLMAAQTMGHASISANESLTESQRNAANELLAALGKWAGGKDLANPELARAALESWVKDARKINLKNLEELQALEFEEMVDRAGILLAATREMLTSYGFNLNDVYDSARAEVLRQQGDTALVRVSFSVLDTNQQFDIVLLRENGRWLPESQIFEYENPELSRAPESEI
ncbi:MAG: hypothetical protein HKN59_07475 [Gammaproteobacteria bacterium]|nr:hypothetical protein [Gammaproteobacteria bacterium]